MKRGATKGRQGQEQRIASLEKNLVRSKKAHELLQREIQDLRWVLRLLADTTVHYDDLSTFADELVLRSMQFLPCDSGSIIVPDGDTTVLRIMGAQKLANRERNEITFSVGVPGKEGFAGVAFRTGMPIFSNSPTTHPSFVSVPWQATIRRFDCLLACPFMVAGKPVAVLSLHNKQPVPRFTDGDVSRVEALALHFAPVFRLAQLSEELRRLSRYDDLTGCYRGDRFQANVEQEIPTRGAGYRLAHFLVLDADEFSTINNTLGHVAGDKVIRAIGQALRTAFADREGAMISRYGGDEFMSIIPSHSYGEAGELADKVRSVACIDLGALGLDTAAMGRKTLTVSVGVHTTELCHLRRTGWYEEAFRAADRAMYEEKARKKGASEASVDERVDHQLVEGGLNGPTSPQSR